MDSESKNCIGYNEDKSNNNDSQLLKKYIHDITNNILIEFQTKLVKLINFFCKNK